ncbi:MAG: Archaebacterial flagellin [Candidatus Methanolliviera sp. GoM_asphalt]|nr:MAG: Archaebacterial flagellin [Candidatus Methanolliviera sp. GoM_asphalt]
MNVTNRAGSAVNSSVVQATSAIEVSGRTLGLDTSGDSKIDNVLVWIENTAGGTPVDMTNMMVNFRTKDTTFTILPSGFKEGKEITAVESVWPTLYQAKGKPSSIPKGYWGVVRISPGVMGDYDNMLEPGEKMQLSINLLGKDEIAGKAKGVSANEPFVLELKPSGGGTVCPLSMRAPAHIDAVNELY